MGNDSLPCNPHFVGIWEPYQDVEEVLFQLVMLGQWKYLFRFSESKWLGLTFRWLGDIFDVTRDTTNSNYQNNLFKAGISPKSSLTKSSKQTQSKPTVAQNPWWNIKSLRIQCLNKGGEMLDRSSSTSLIRTPLIPAGMKLSRKTNNFNPQLKCHCGEYAWRVTLFALGLFDYMWTALRLWHLSVFHFIFFLHEK